MCARAHAPRMCCGGGSRMVFAQITSTCRGAEHEVLVITLTAKPGVTILAIPILARQLADNPYSRGPRKCPLSHSQ